MRDNQNKPRLAPLLICGSLTGLGVLLVVLLGTVFRNWLIIGLGIRAFNTVRNIVSLLAIGGAICTVGSSVPLLKSVVVRRHELEQARSQQALENKVVSEYAADSANPTSTRKMLIQLKADKPMAAEMIDRCLRQMDEMDTFQEQLDRLIQVNGAIYLQKNAVSTLNSVERQICRSYQLIVNWWIIADVSTGLDPSKLQKVEDKLKTNELLLGKTRRLLDLSVDWIEKTNTTSVSKDDETLIDAELADIASILKEDK